VTISGEDSLIARFFRPLATAPGALGLTDDAALLACAAGEELVVTADAVVAGVHFFPDDPPDSIARKALRVNLSDLAAKGAAPAGFVLTLALPARDEAWLAAFAGALGEDAAQFGCPLLGGDTVSTPGPLMIAITAFGRVPAGRMVRRDGARPGDLVFVTGSIGDATLGLALRRGGAALSALAGDPQAVEALIARYRVPQPRNALAPALAAHAHAAMDVSDGLAGDLAKLCAAAGVAARVAADRVPLSAAARAALAAGAADLPALLAGGDDYEVLCTVAPNRAAGFVAAAAAAGVAVSEIGTILPGPGEVQFRAADGAPLALARLSYSHF
jgi:thiamine-monophosphate kinase